ncbi:MAG: peroxidase-related enzyme [Pseudomonadota bacterium]
MTATHTSYFETLSSAADPLMTALGHRQITGQAVLDAHQDVMRGPSPLSAGQREFIAAFVSRLNDCPLCSAAHRRVAELLGMSPEILDACCYDFDAAPIAANERALLRYAKRLTLRPNTIDSELATAVFAAGWSEEALHDTIHVVGLFCLINRFVLGHGIQISAAAIEASAQKLAQHGYG